MEANICINDVNPDTKVRKGSATKSDEFSCQVPKGGGAHFQSKNLCFSFWVLSTSFLSMILIQKNNFKVQGMFFNDCIEKNQNKTHYDLVARPFL